MMKLLLKRLAWTDQLSEEEQNLLIGSVSRVQSFAPGETIVPAEVPVDFSSVILQGLSNRQKVLENGARQITAFHLAGDFCDLHTYVLKTLPDSVVAMTACEVAILSHAQLDRIFRESYHVARLFWASTLIDASIFRQWIVSRATISKCTPCPLVLRALSPLQNGRIDQGHDLFAASHTDRPKRRPGLVARTHEPHLRHFTFRRSCNLCSANSDDP
jgi:Cyclic nucleotide-binding domain